MRADPEREGARRRLSMVLMVAGLVLAGLVSIRVFLWGREAERALASVPTILVVVARTEIPARTIISGNQLSLVPALESAIPPGAVSVSTASVSDAELEIRSRDALAKVGNKYTAQRIYQHEVINLERLAGDAPGGVANPSLEIPPGKVWYHFPVRIPGGNPANDRVNIAFLNAVRPGDYLDVYYTTQETPARERIRPTEDAMELLKSLYTRRVMENLKVVNVGLFPKGAETAAREDRYITLEVTAEQALTLKWLKDAATLTGNIELVLRSPQDAETSPVSTVDFDRVSERTGIGTGR